ncbi:MAG: hypothetical protein JST14_03395 [Bacteroidetes bacterium]|nr:hypothetical protein [Bacteroidota bacterium]
MAKLTLDVLSFRDSLENFNQVNAKQYNETSGEILSRLKRIMDRQGKETDTVKLGYLSKDEKFLRSTAQLIDSQRVFLDYVFRSFDRINDAYWDFIIKGDKMKDDLTFHKQTIERLYVRIELLRSIHFNKQIKAC